MNITINRGSDAMVNKGMLARASVQLMTADGSVMLQLDDMLIRDGKDGPWVSPPARQVEGKDGKTVYYKYYRFYPDNEEMRRSIEKRIIDQYNATPIGTGNTAPSRTNSAPKNNAPPARPARVAAPAPAPQDVGMNLDNFSFEVG